MVSPVLDSLIEPLGTSPTSVGLIISAWTAPGIVMVPVAGLLADRYGRKPILVASLFALGTGGTAIAFTTNFRLVLALRFLQGVGYGGLVPIITTSIGDMFAGSKEATGQGLRLAVNGVSGTVFPLVAGGLAVFAWQYPFLLYGIAIPAAAAVFLWFEEPRSDNPSADPAGGSLIAYSDELYRLVRQRRALAYVVARATPVVVWIAFLTYNSVIVGRLLGGTPPQTGALLAVGNLVFGIAASQAGRVTSSFGNRFVPLVLANAVLVTGFTTALLAPGVGVAAVGIAGAGAGLGTILSLYRSILTGLAPESLRGGLVSLSAAAARVTVTGTPVAMGGVIAVATPHVGFGKALMLAGLGAALVGGGGGIACLLVASRSPPVRVAQTGATDR